MTRLKRLYKELKGSVYPLVPNSPAAKRLTVEVDWHRRWYVDIYIDRFKRKHPVKMVLKNGSNPFVTITDIPFDIPIIRTGILALTALRGVVVLYDLKEWRDNVWALPLVISFNTENSRYPYEEVMESVVMTQIKIFEEREVKE